MILPTPFTELFITLCAWYLTSWRLLGDKKRYLELSFVASTLHAACVGGYALYVLSTTDKYQTCIAPRAGDDWTYAYVMVAYLLADVLCVALWCSPRDIVAHHLIAALGLYLASTHDVAHGLGLRFALTELGTVPLNVCWYLKKQLDALEEEARQQPEEVVKTSSGGRGTTWTSTFTASPHPPSSHSCRKERLQRYLKASAIVLLVVYFLVRVASIPELVYRCYPQIVSVLPLYLSVFGLISVSYMQYMNVVWFLGLVRRARSV
jgi:hypothetical protein